MREPVAGFASKKDAIAAMMESGLSDDEIVYRTGASQGSINTYRSKVRTRNMMSLKKATKARRIIAKALPVIAEAIGCTPSQLHLFIKRNYFGFDRAEPEPALPPEQKDGGIEPGKRADPAVIAIPITEPEPIPAFLPQREPAMLVMTKKPTDKITDAKFYTLRTPDGLYVHMAGESVTSNRDYAYRGDRHQALAMRKRFPECAISPFN